MASKIVFLNKETCVDYINKMTQGDCLDILSDISNDSVDLIVTDPPYGLSFMGKAWDKALPPVGVWKECLRVLKPGAFAFVMCIPRQDCLSRMIINLEDAGFRVNFSPIYHTFATGFPKAANLSKSADRRSGIERKKGALRTDGRGKWDVKMQKQPGDGDTGVGHADGSKQTYYETFPATPEAKALDGAYAGFSPKPVVEVIIVAMAPLSEKTYLDQALTNGKGCTWLSDGRIPYESDNDKSVVEAKCNFTEDSKAIGFGTKESVYGTGNTPLEQARDCVKPAGRFAPHLLVSDSVLDTGEITKSGVTIQPCFESHNVQGFQPNPKAIPGYNQHADSGGFSRYFDLDKWAEYNLPTLDTFPFCITPKASKGERDAGLDETYTLNPNTPVEIIQEIEKLLNRR